MLRNDIARKLADFPFEKLGVKLALLFGSFARGDADARSDVDLAFRLEEPFDPMVKLDLLSEATSRLNTDRVDVVILNSALGEAPALASRALSEGLVLYDADPAGRIDLHIRARKLAEDERHLLRIADEARQGGSHG
ncbi:MAG: nucleotidyltransferase domain-containing protein [Deltaproteobacteria bacterium]|nr:nucleotidyltransferase domain-containing protein [Deltaproteobacteria bacterium]